MLELTRRRFIAFIGTSAAAVAASTAMARSGAIAAQVQRGVAPGLAFTPLRLPHPLPVYAKHPSFLATGIKSGTFFEPETSAQLDEYTVIDDVVVPPEFERYVIVSWGDRVFPRPDDYVGYNHDFTSFIPYKGNRNDGFLFINHEYVSYPFSFLAPDTPEDLEGFPESFPLVVGDVELNEKNTETLGEMLYNVGGSVLRIHRHRAGERFAVAFRDQSNRRIHGLSGLAINADRSDGFESVTSWGSRPRQQGDDEYLIGTGPAAEDVFENVNADGLGNRIIGTAYNCSGGTTPWGTVMSAEENFQGSEEFFIGVTEGVKPNGSQTEYTEGTSGAEFGLVGEKYGWMVEIDPADPDIKSRKHTALGRFRHENIAFRVKKDRPLIAYMGDDRRGGHTWKFVSRDRVRRPADKANSHLLAEGTLYVAKFYPDGNGEWLPLKLNTPTDPNQPTKLAEVELAEIGSAQRDAGTRFPSREGLAEATEDGGSIVIDINNEGTLLSDYQGKHLGEFYETQGAVLCDAFLAANLIGGTPCARPEDIEVHPRTQEVFIAYTDGAAGGDGYPDSNIFVVGKHSDSITGTQSLGGLYKIIEDSSDGTGTTFRWDRFIHGGEVGAEDGAGFAAVDNLLFDKRGNLWGVTDMSTSRHNGFRTGANPEERTIDHTETGDVSAYAGVFGNNWLFAIPTLGEDAGMVVPFAYGPPRCEMTGPTFIGDTLILAVQHPGEDSPINDGTPESTLERSIEMLDSDGSLFTQTRQVPRGSNWPSNLSGDTFGPPRSATIGIRRISRHDELAGFEDFERDTGES